MSPRTPRLTAKQVIKQLKNSGFIEIGQTGSHLKLFNQKTRRTAIVPIHSNFSRQSFVILMLSQVSYFSC